MSQAMLGALEEIPSRVYIPPINGISQLFFWGYKPEIPAIINGMALISLAPALVEDLARCPALAPHAVGAAISRGNGVGAAGPRGQVRLGPGEPLGKHGERFPIWTYMGNISMDNI